MQLFYLQDMFTRGDEATRTRGSYSKETVAARGSRYATESEVPMIDHYRFIRSCFYLQDMFTRGDEATRIRGPYSR